MRRNIFDEKISCWQTTARTKENNITVTIGQFLQSGEAYLNTPTMPTDIARLRLLYDTALQCYPTNPEYAASLFDQYKKQKRWMPLASMGGTFRNGGLHDDLIEPSKVLCLDIDSVKPTDLYKYAGKGIPNAHVKDWNLLKRQLSQLVFVSYISLSIGGHGLFLLIPIEDPSKHADYWRTLEWLFKEKLNLTIDPQTKDITRPRFISYDQQPYINTDAEVFSFIRQEQQAKPQGRLVASNPHPANSTEDAVCKCVEEIERRHIDITSNYDDWVDVASSLWNGLGEAGKQYYDRLSVFHPEYNEKDVSYKWKKNKNRHVDIVFFFNLCKKFGIKYKESQPIKTTPRIIPATPIVEATTVRKCRIIPIPLYPEIQEQQNKEEWFSEQWATIMQPEAVQDWQQKLAVQGMPF